MDDFWLPGLFSGMTSSPRQGSTEGNQVRSTGACE